MLLLLTLESLRSDLDDERRSEDCFRCVVELLEDFLLAVKVEKSVYPQSAEFKFPRSMLLLRRLSGDMDCLFLSGDMEMFLDLAGEIETD